MSDIENHEPLPRGIYLLPNLFTTGGLFAGFYAIVAGMQGLFEISAIAIFIAMVMDGLDGRVARLTNTASAFGAQYDSLADMVSFGIAPALVIYHWGLYELGKVGWLAAFVYAVATALRLARFNVQVETQDKRFFTGLPCPAAAALVASMIWIGTDFKIPGQRISEFMAIVTMTIGLLMVSNVRFYSFKDIDLKGKVPFMAIVMVVLIYTLIAYDPPKVLFATTFLYALSGPLMWLKSRFNKDNNSNLSNDEPVVSETMSNETNEHSDKVTHFPKR